MLKKVIVTLACLVVASGLIIWKFFPQAVVTPKPPATPPVREAAPPKAEPKGTEYAKDKVIQPGEVPTLGPAGEYKMNGDTVDVELSQWPGYAPIIVANGGLAPNPDSYFAKKYGFKLKIILSEAEVEGWQAINSGKNAVTATTVDVLALYGSQLKVEVPIQLDFSRGGDGILVTKDITSVNQLKGKIITAAQFTESDFFVRFLAQEAGLKVRVLRALGDTPDPETLNLLLTRTGEDAADVFADSVDKGDNVISGAVTWSPKTVEVPAQFPDKVKLLTTNRNMLVVADILLVNAGFAKKNPQIMKGLVEGILAGVDMIAKDPQGTTPVIAKALKMSDDETRKAMADVHLSNHAENLLFFSPDPGQIGNFNEIYYTAVYAYGKEIIPNAIATEKLVNRSYLEQLTADGLFAGQQVALAPSKSAEKTEVLEKNPLLTKQIRFRFQPNTAEMDMADVVNQQALDDLLKLLKLTPGSYLMLRGHLDNSKADEFRQKGEAFFRRQAVRAVEQSKQRAESVKSALLKAGAIDVTRIDTEGRGWDDPLPGAKPDDNRRVEVQLFTLE